MWCKQCAGCWTIHTFIWQRRADWPLTCCNSVIKQFKHSNHKNKLLFEIRQIAGNKPCFEYVLTVINTVYFSIKLHKHKVRLSKFWNSDRNHNALQEMFSSPLQSQGRRANKSPPSLPLQAPLPLPPFPFPFPSLFSFSLPSPFLSSAIPSFPPSLRSRPLNPARGPGGAL